MKKIFLGLLVFSVLINLPAFGFGGTETDAAKELGELVGVRKADSKNSKDRDEKGLEHKDSHKKKKDKKILVPEEDIRLELDRTTVPDKEQFDAE